MRIFMPGQAVPRWLFEVTVDEKECNHLKFSGVIMVFNTNGGYRCKPLIGNSVLIELKGHGESCINIKGQSPVGGDGGVTLDCKPVLSWLEFALFGAIISIVGLM